jgi:hypothetical protein
MLSIRSLPICFIKSPTAILVTVIVLQLLLKTVQVCAEAWEVRPPATTLPSGRDVQRPTLKRQIPAYIARRRLDDAYFWMFVALFQTSLSISRSANASPGRPPRRLLLTTALYVAMASLYVGFAYLEPGTVFTDFPRSQWLSNNARLTAITGQWAEALLCHGLGILATILLVKRAWTLFETQSPSRPALLKALLTPLTGFSVYFFVSQALTGSSLTFDEITAVGGALTLYALPFLVLYVKFKPPGSSVLSVLLERGK